MDLFHSQKFHDRVNDLLEQWHTPGVAIAILQDQKIASKGYGYASLSRRTTVSPDTLFDIASSSKSLTAASVALLVADDDRYPQIQWDSKMSSLLPDDFVMSEKNFTEDVTVEDILSHRSGLPRHDFSYLGIRAEHPDTPQSVTQNLRNLDIAAPIRSKYMYCNLMFTVATHLVEHLSGVSFAEYLRQHFFQPLGMDSTHLQPEAAIAAGLKDRMASFYCWDDKAGFKFVEWEQSPESQGAGLIFTCVNDHIKWVTALIYQEHPISEDVFQGLIKPQIIPSPDDGPEELGPYTSPTLYAAGLETYHYRGYQVIGHDGQTGGSGSRHFWLPEVKFGGAILANSDSASDAADIIAKDLIDEVLGVPEAERPDWAAFQQKRSKAYESKIVKGDELRKKLCPNFDGTAEAQNIALTAYTGRYWNAGYHSVNVVIQDDQLFVDAMDRTMGFSLTFEHICAQTKYVAHLSSYSEGGDEEYAAEFQFDESKEKVLRMGVKFEDDLGNLVWFKRVYDEAS